MGFIKKLFSKDTSTRNSYINRNEHTITSTSQKAKNMVLYAMIFFVATIGFFTLNTNTAYAAQYKNKTFKITDLGDSTTITFYGIKDSTKEKVKDWNGHNRGTISVSYSSDKKTATVTMTDVRVDSWTPYCKVQTTKTGWHAKKDSKGYTWKVVSTGSAGTSNWSGTEVHNEQDDLDNTNGLASFYIGAGFKANEIKPLWERNTYTIKYNNNGGSGSMASTTHTYGVESATSANSFTKTGYTFAGWKMKRHSDGKWYYEKGSDSGWYEEGKQPSGYTKVVYGNKHTVTKQTSVNNDYITWYAQWTPKKTTVTYHSNNGEGKTSTETYTYDVSGQKYKAQPSTWKKTGYHAEGWNEKKDKTGTNHNFSGSVSNSWINTKYSSTDLYEKWTANTYYVRYNGNGATSGSMSNSTHTYDTAKNLTANAFKRNGYDFNGWNTKSDKSGTSYSNSQSVKNLTSTNGGTVDLYAKWKKITYKITYNLNGGTQGSGAKTTYDIETATFNLPTPTRTGYTFAGWYDSLGNKVTKVTKGSYGNKEYWAKWTANTYKIAYNLNGGSLSSGYDFTKTSDSDSWQGNPKTNSVSYNGTSGYKNGYIYIETPTKTGYTFAGWSVTGMDSTEHKYWYNNAGQTSTATSWSLGTVDKTVTKFKNLRATSGTVTFTANWTKNSYNISYSLGGGTLSYGYDKKYNTGTYTYQRNPKDKAVYYDGTDGYTNAYIMIDNPTREGYTFTGWTVTGMDSCTHYYWYNNAGQTSTATSWSAGTIDKSVTCFRNLRATSGTVTFTANWTKNSYKIAYNLNGGTLTNGYDKTYDSGSNTYQRNPKTNAVYYDGTNGYTSNYILIDNPTRTGYTFAGWTVSGMDSCTHGYWYNGTGKTSTATSWAKGTIDKSVTCFRNLRSTSGTVTFTANWTATKYYLDINGMLDSTKTSNITGFGTCDVYINGSLVKSNVSDFNFAYDYGTTYEIKNLKAADGHTYNGLESDSNALSGTLGVTTTAKTVNSTSYPLTTNVCEIIPNITTDKYYLDINGVLDGVDENNIYGYGTIDIYINGELFRDDVYDSCQVFPYGTKFEIKDIKTQSGKKYKGVAKGAITGYVGKISGTSLYDSITSDGCVGKSYVNLIFDTIDTSKYYIEYDGNGADGGAMQTSEHTVGATTQLTKNAFTKTGYTFLNWNTAADGTGTSYTDEQSVNNLTTGGKTITLYAQWDPIYYIPHIITNGVKMEYSIYFVNTFDENGVWIGLRSIMKNPDEAYVSYSDGSETGSIYLGYFELESPKREGYTFKGWSITGLDDCVHSYFSDENENVVNTSDTTIILKPISDGSYYLKNLRSSYGEVYIEAIWEANTYSIAYNLDGGSISAEYDSTYIDTAGFTYQRNPKDKSVSYGGTSGYDFTNFYIDKPTKAGYTFTGWTITGLDDCEHHYWTFPNGTATLNKTNDTTLELNSLFYRNLRSTSGTVTFTANWKANTYVIQYDANGGTGTMEPTAHTYGIRSLTRENEFTRKGYTFTGWNCFRTSESTWLYKDSDGNNGWFAEGEEEDDYNLGLISNGSSVIYHSPYDGDTVIWYAQWKNNTYTIQYDANGGEGEMEPTTHTYDIASNTSENTFTRTGYTFSGWHCYRTSDQKWLYSNSDGNTGWYTEGNQPEGYSLMLRPSGESVSWHCFVDDDTAIWYAQWTPNTYNVEYNLDGGSISAEYDSTYVDSAGLTYQRNPKEKSVTYGGTSGYYCTNFFIDQPTRTGYTFAGWSITGLDDCEHHYWTFPNGTATLNKTNDTTLELNSLFYRNLRSTSGTVTFTANWTANEYKLYLDPNGGTIYDDKTELYEETSSPLIYGSTNWESFDVSTYYKLGYSFDGWYDSPTGGTQLYTADGTAVKGTDYWSEDGTYCHEGDMTLYAHWVANTYNIDYNLNGGTLPSGYDTTRTDDESVTEYYTWQRNPKDNPVSYNGTPGYLNAYFVVENPKKNGYIFAGWTITGMDSEEHHYWNSVDNHDVAISGTEFSTGTDSIPINTVAFRNLRSTSGTVTFTANWIAEKYNFSLKGCLDGIKKDTLGDYGTADIYINGELVASQVSEFNETYDYGTEYEIKNITASEGHTYNGINSTSYALKGVIGESNYTEYYKDTSGGTYGQTIVRLDFSTNQYLFDIKGLLDDVESDTIDGYGTVDVYIDGELVADDCTDYKKTLYYGTTFEITDIKQSSGRTFEGAITGALSGTIGEEDEDTIVTLVFTTGYEITEYHYYQYGNHEDDWRLFETSTTFLRKDEKFQAYTIDCPEGYEETFEYEWWNAANDTKLGEGVIDYESEDAGIDVSENYQVRVFYKAKTYTVTVDANGGTLDNSFTKSKGSDNSFVEVTYDNENNRVIGTAQRTGYTFDGWTITENGDDYIYDKNGNWVEGDYWTATEYNGNSDLAKWIYDGDVTIYAKWIPITYTIQYNGNGSTSGTTASSTHTYDIKKALTANGFAKSGNRFAGWSTSAKGDVVYRDGESVVNLASTQGAVVTLYAQWGDGYMLTFDANGGTCSPASKLLSAGEKYGTLATAEKTGYTLDGWYTQATGGTKVSENDTMGTVDTTVYAHWTANTYKVKYELDGGSMTSDYDGTFNGKDSSGSFTCQMNPKEKPVYYDGTPGFTNKYITVTNPSKAGYIFTGWTVTGMDDSIHDYWTEDGHQTTSSKVLETGTVQIPASTTQFKNLTSVNGATVTFTANWELAEYSINYHLDGGQFNYEDEVIYQYSKNDTVILPDDENVYKERNTFVGWYDNPEFTGSVITSIEKGTTGDKDFYAKYELDKYNLIFDANGGECDVESKLVEYSKPFGEIPTPTWKGHRFVGWYAFIGEENVLIDEDTIMPDEDVIAVADWTTDIYNITYVLNDGYFTQSYPETYTVENSVTLVNPYRPYYVFDGWYETADFSGDPVTKIKKGSMGDKVYYAKWIDIYSVSSFSIKDYRFIDFNQIETLDPSSPYYDEIKESLEKETGETEIIKDSE